MKLSKMGLKTQKNIGNEDCYISELLSQSGQLKKFSAGCFGFGTMLVKIKRNIEDIIRKYLEEIGCAEVQYSIIQSKKYWEASGRWDKYIESGTMFTTKGRHSDYAVSATAEEMSVEMLKTHIKSYRDLGICHFQIGTKFRDELRVQGGLIKSKEFNMMDAYSFDESKEKMEKFYDVMKLTYHKIFKELGFENIKSITSVNDMGGKVASEFMFFDDEYGQDTIFCNDELNLYVNEEVFDLKDEKLKELILGEHRNIDKSCFEKRKAIELGHIFQNDQVYSKMMGGTFIDREGKLDYYYNGCYGIGVSRLIALIAVNSLRKHGKLIWDESISAFDINIIVKNKDDVLLRVGEQIYNQLITSGIKACLDDRDYSIGEKLKDNELFGIRKTIIIGNNFKNDGVVDMEDRLENKKQELKLDQIITLLNKNC